MSKTPKLGILASEKCGVSRQNKDWLCFNEFVKLYETLLSKFVLVTNEDTEPQIHDAKSPGNTLTFEIVGSGFQAKVRMASMLAKGCLTRLLIFDDPEDCNVESPENYALIRNANTHGSLLQYEMSLK